MQDKLKQIIEQAKKELQNIKESGELEAAKTKFLGRKGELAKVMDAIRDLAKEEKPKFGAMANKAKQELADLFDNTQKMVKGKVKDTFFLDPTLPGKKRDIGHLHPSTQVQHEIEEAFSRLGFAIYDGPQLESEYYNFTALNIPDDHPARDTQDTFWLEGNHLLRTQTSNLQVRMLERYGAPFRGIFPGRVFRYESTDASHEHTFFQMEGLMVDKNINIGNLIATMKSLLSSVFHTDVAVRLRPGFFPFVEPGFELDIRCLVCGGDGCSVCKKSGWVELMPCGMVHPQVLKNGGVDPDQYSGFAFGLGLTRLVMMKYKIDDIRLLESGDLRFLRQF